MPTILLNKIRIGGKAPTNIKKGSADVKYVKKGNTVIYDTLNYYSYGTPSLTFTYPSGKVSASGGSKTPNAKSWSQSKTAYGHSGATYAQTAVSGTINSFSIVSGSSYGTLNTSTGVFTFSANSSASDRSVTIRASVSSNSKSNTADVTITQEKQGYYTVRVTWTSFYQVVQDVGSNNVQWTCFGRSGLPSYHPDNFDMPNYGEVHTYSFPPNGSLTLLHPTNPNTTVDVPDRGTVYINYYNPALGRWRFLDQFKHDSTQSYYYDFSHI
jgi:hypothetical protein